MAGEASSRPEMEEAAENSKPSETGAEEEAVEVAGEASSRPGTSARPDIAKRHLPL